MKKKKTTKKILNILNVLTPPFFFFFFLHKKKQFTYFCTGKEVKFVTQEKKFANKMKLYTVKQNISIVASLRSEFTFQNLSLKKTHTQHTTMMIWKEK